MPRQLLFQPTAERQLARMWLHDPQRHRKVLTCLAALETDNHDGKLDNVQYEALKPVNGEPIWGSYIDGSNVPYRVFWHFGPDEDAITILAITPHP